MALVKDNELTDVLLETPYFFTKLSNEEKLKILAERSIPNLSLKKVDGRFTRHFQKQWYAIKPWLTGSVKKNRLFCFHCLLFSKNDYEWCQVGIGEDSLKHFMAKARKHECSLNHLTATGKVNELRAKREEEDELGVKVEDDLNSEEICHSESLIKEECTEQPSCSAFTDVEITLLHLRQEKLLLELEKLSEERERIAAEKKNVVMHLEILKLRLQLMGSPTSAQIRISPDRNNVGTENCQESVNTSFSSLPIQQIQDTSMGKPKSSGSALGSKSSFTLLSSSKTPGSFCIDNSLIRISTPPNINSAPIHKEPPSTSKSPASFHPINRHVLPNTVENFCALPIAIPCSASEFLIPLLNIEDLPPSITPLNIFQTGINNVETSGKTGSSQIGPIPQEWNSQHQNVLLAKPASQSTQATNNTLITGSNPPPTDSNKTMLNCTRLDGSRKELESTDHLIIPHSKDNSVEWEKRIVVSTSDSAADSILRAKEKIDPGGPSKKRRLSTEDSR